MIYLEIYHPPRGSCRITDINTILISTTLLKIYLDYGERTPLPLVMISAFFEVPTNCTQTQTATVLNLHLPYRLHDT